MSSKRSAAAVNRPSAALNQNSFSESGTSPTISHSSLSSLPPLTLSIIDASAYTGLTVREIRHLITTKVLTPIWSTSASRGGRAKQLLLADVLRKYVLAQYGRAA